MLRAALLVAGMSLAGAGVVYFVNLLGFWPALESAPMAGGVVGATAVLTGWGLTLVASRSEGRPRRAFLFHLAVVAIALAMVVVHAVFLQGVARGGFGAGLQALTAIGRQPFVAWLLPLGLWLAASLALGLPLGLHAWGAARPRAPSAFRKFLAIAGLGVATYLAGPVISHSMTDKARAFWDQPHLIVALVACVVAAPCLILVGGPLSLLLSLSEELLSVRPEPARAPARPEWKVELAPWDQRPARESPPAGPEGDPHVRDAM